MNVPEAAVLDRIRAEVASIHREVEDLQARRTVPDPWVQIVAGAALALALLASGASLAQSRSNAGRLGEAEHIARESKRASDCYRGYLAIGPELRVLIPDAAVVAVCPELAESFRIRDEILTEADRDPVG